MVSAAIERSVVIWQLLIRVTMELVPTTRVVTLKAHFQKMYFSVACNCRAGRVENIWPKPRSV